MGLFSPLIALIFGLTVVDASPCTGLCPLGWELWNGSCYKLTDARLNWVNAGLKCGEMGGAVMASPSSMEENNYILAKSLKEKTFDRLWLNCNDLHAEGKWDCKNAGVFSNWKTEDFEPDGGTQENCAVIIEHVSGKWVDVKCNQEHLALCKREQKNLKLWRLLLASRLTENVVGEYPASSLATCATMCDYDRSCSSFNYLGAEKKCQFNNSTRSGDGDPFLMKDNVCVYGEK